MQVLHTSSLVDSFVKKVEMQAGNLNKPSGALALYSIVLQNDTFIYLPLVCYESEV